MTNQSSQRDIDRREVKAGRMTMAAYEAKYHAPEPDLRALLVKAMAALEPFEDAAEGIINNARTQPRPEHIIHEENGNERVVLTWQNFVFSSATAKEIREGLK